MKAIVQDAYGEADVLELRDIPTPTPRPAQVLVGVRAAGCGPDVWHIMTGLPLIARLALGLRRPRVSTRGWDFAGVVEAVGADVRAFAVGDEVFGTAPGTFAEHAVADVDKIARKPATATFIESAAVPVSGGTALQAVRDVANIETGQRVLIVGAAGGVGSFAVQLATAYGAQVTGVCSTAKADVVRELGASDVVDYTRDGLGTGTYDAIIDTAGRRPLAELRARLTPDGVAAIVGGDGGGRLTGGFERQLLAPLRSVFGGPKLRPVTQKENAADLDVLRDLIESGRVRPLIDRTYALADAADAVRYLSEGHPTGKVVVTI